MTAARLLSVILIALMSGGAASAGEVTVRQGEPAAQQFHSPMILEVPLPSPANLPKGASRSTTPDLRKFACEGVVISQLEVLVTRRPAGPSGTLSLEVSGTLHVPRSEDRHVDLVFVVKKGDTDLGRGERRKIDAEEGRHTKFKARITIRDAEFEDAFSQDPQPTLEITMSVISNA